VQKISNKYLIQGKLLLIPILGYVPFIKGQFMPVLCLRTGQSLKNVSKSMDYLSRLEHFLPHPGGEGLGGSGGWGESRSSGRKSVYGKIAPVYLLIVGLTDL
jgi:hypothetical protein